MSLESRRERAERMLLDAAAVIPLPPHKLIERHNQALAALRTVWKSRRELQESLEDAEARCSSLGTALDKSRRRAAELEGENVRLREQASGLESDYALTLAELADLRIQLNGGAR